MRGFTFSSTSRRAMAAGVAVLATMSAACSDAVTEPKSVVNVPAATSPIVIQPIFFKTAISEKQVYRCLEYCTAWGIDNNLTRAISGGVERYWFSS